MTDRRLSRLGTLGLAVLAIALVTGCATPPSDPSRTSQALADVESTALGRRFAEQARTSAGQSGVRLLIAGSDALAARMALADAAERTLELQYYSIGDDRAANAVLAHVAAAAERGVRVRILIDDLDAAGRDADLAALAAHANVEIRVFNPFRVRGPFGIAHLFELAGDTDRLNRRMHNKLMAADNVVAIVGGRNLGNEYFVAGEGAPFVDLDLVLAGPVVAELSAGFDLYWNSRYSIAIDAVDWRDAGPAAARIAALEAHRRGLHASAYDVLLRASGFDWPGGVAWLDLEWAPVTVYADRPDKVALSEAQQAHVGEGVRALLESAHREILLVSPYLVPGGEGVRLLSERVRAGVRVRALTNSLASTDSIAAHAGYARWRGRLLAAGVELYEMRAGGHDPETHAARPRDFDRAPTRLHAKAIVVDRRRVFAGSLNLDPRSQSLNTEVGVLVDSPVLAAEAATLFERMAGSAASFEVRLDADGLAWIGHEPGESLVHRSEPDASLARRLALPWLAAFAPDEWL